MTRRSAEGSSSIERLATGGALTAVGVFLVWFLVKVGAVVDGLYLNPDFASSLVLPELMGDRGSGDVVLGNYAWLEPLYAMHLTRWLPAHRQVWEAAPLVVYAITVALVGWTVRRSVSRRAGLLVALAMAAPAPLVLGYVAVPNAHGHTLFGVAILASLIVTLPRMPSWGTARRCLWAAVLALSLAAGTSSDVLLLIGGVLPFLLAVAYGWRLAGLPGRFAILAAGACLIGVGTGRLLAALAEEAGIRETGVGFPVASVGRAADNARQLLEDTALFAHGRLGGTPSAFDLVLEVVGIAAMIIVPVLLVALLVRGASAVQDGERPPEQRMLLVYWAAALAGIAGAFVFSSAPVGIGSTRYVTVLWPAILSLAAIVFGRRALLPVAVLASLAAILGCIELARGSYTPSAGGFPADDLARLERFVAAHRLDHGYAAYPNAPVITARTDFDVRTYPVERCSLGEDGRCPFFLHRVDAWYCPSRGERSFYLVAERPGWPLLGGPPSRWPPPETQARFGPFHVFVYDFDLAGVLTVGANAAQSSCPAARR